MANSSQSNQKEANNEGEARAPPVWKTSAGGVQLAVWRNPTPKGGSFHTVTMDRRYKRKDGEWASSGNLRLNDIPKAILALQKAYERMVLSRDGQEEDEEGEDAPSSSAPSPSQAEIPEEVREYLASIRPDLFAPSAHGTGAAAARTAKG